MMRTVARLVRDADDAADAFQNVLTMIWRDLERIDRHPNPHGYILRMCVSASYDILRKRSRGRRRVAILETRARYSTKPEALETCAARELERLVLEAVMRLPRQQAQAILLQVIEGEPYDKIAQTLGCSQATARSHISKGKARLREMLSGLISGPLEVNI